MMKGGGVKRKAKPAADYDDNIYGYDDDPYFDMLAMDTTTQAPLRKRLNASLLESEHSEEPPNLEDLWKAAFPFGIEWDQSESLYNKDKWDFSNLEQELQEEGRLHPDTIGHNNKVYLFCHTETMGDVVIQILVAVVSPSPPSFEIAIRTAGNEFKEIAPMKKLKMDWIPYISRGSHVLEREVMKSSPQTYVLGCTRRRGVKRIKEDSCAEFQYCMPYVFNPEIEYDEADVEGRPTEALIMFFPRVIHVSFDWKHDEVEKFADRLIKSENLSAKQKGKFIEFVEKEMENEKRRKEERREDVERRMGGMSYEEAKAAFEDMRFYKFYPLQAQECGIMVMHPNINYYYGKAHEVL